MGRWKGQCEQDLLLTHINIRISFLRLTEKEVHLIPDSLYFLLDCCNGCNTISVTSLGITTRATIFGHSSNGG